MFECFVALGLFVMTPIFVVVFMTTESEQLKDTRRFTEKMLEELKKDIDKME